MNKLFFIVGFTWELCKGFIAALLVRREEQRRSGRVVVNGAKRKAGG